MESGNRNKRIDSLEDRENKMLELLSTLSIPSGSDTATVWERINARVNDKKDGKVVRIRSWSIGIAASMALLLTFYFLLQQEPTTTITTNKGEKVTFFLPDSSTVIMNADSKITYTESTWEENRQLNLDGEAFFKVKKGEKFQVISNTGVVEVLGTSFNIFARNNDYNVACVTGKVKVSNSKLNDFKILNPGFTTSVRNNEVQAIMAIDNANNTGWLSGEFHFEKTPLSMVIEEIERQYNVTISSTEKINQRLYSGYFPDDDLKTTLELVFSPMGLSIEQLDDKSITIKDIEQETIK